MYFTNNNFFHGIMFHHFHDDKIHKKTQGSINQNEFYKLIKFVGRKNILDADDFFVRCKENKLTEKNVCFTFDDAIKSGIKILCYDCKLSNKEIKLNNRISYDK